MGRLLLFGLTKKNVFVALWGVLAANTHIHIRSLTKSGYPKFVLFI